ncbi:phasin family protein [Olsenella urininfantis]|uniref:phasin family protein n=1 Tax=Olsenella urininfantis TaxID=1871033 RepID=UPI000986593B|nr:hypothetical protein [Olsenella urininfantis]
MAGFDDLGEGVRKLFLAGVGAVAMGAEKSQEIVEELVKKGELTFEQGKAVNEELLRKMQEAASEGSDNLLRARLRGMSPEERSAWIAKAQQMADELDREPEPVDVEVEVIADEEEGAEAQPEEGDSETGE